MSMIKQHSVLAKPAIRTIDIRRFSVVLFAGFFLSDAVWADAPSKSFHLLRLKDNKSGVTPPQFQVWLFPQMFFFLRNFRQKHEYLSDAGAYL